ncbi:hypothetical protein RUM43_011565 [Polyplax serrata]|uniref:Carbohydrate sulfotransferase n=1 Tax=Polyplax serrata TaxID=468196 RepID=A0AAN8S3R0_POLSC
MRRYTRFFLFTMVGLLFLTMYLAMIIYSKSESWFRQGSLDHDLLPKEVELTEAQTRDILRQIESTNNERIQRVEEVCRRYNLGIFKTSLEKTLEHPPVPQYSVFYFDREDKLSFCPIYKAGSTTWLYNLCLLSGMTDEEIARSNQQLSTLARARHPRLDPTDAEEAFQTTIKLLAVRHPFERLLSAYRDKLENTNEGLEHGSLHFYASFGSKIVRKYRKNGNLTKTWDLLKDSQYMWNPQHKKPAGVEPTFREFILYLINLNLAHYADDHWIPYYLFCTPCLLRYDVIAKVETMDADQLYVIRVLGLQDKIKPRWRHKTQFIQGKYSKLKQIFNAGFLHILLKVVVIFLGNSSLNEVSHLAKIYFSQLTVEEILQLYEKYKIDFELFGYDHTQYLRYASDYSSKI